MVAKYTSVGLFFLFIFLTGIRLNRTGWPHSTLLITIHKLVGLGLAVFLGLTVYRVFQAAPLTALQAILIGITILLFIVNVTTGSLLSTNKPMPAAVTIMNKLMPYLTVLSTAVMLYLLL
jgi:hypothetical protein